MSDSDDQLQADAEKIGDELVEKYGFPDDVEDLYDLIESALRRERERRDRGIVLKRLAENMEEQARLWNGNYVNGYSAALKDVETLSDQKEWEALMRLAAPDPLAERLERLEGAWRKRGWKYMAISLRLDYKYRKAILVNYSDQGWGSSTDERKIWTGDTLEQAIDRALEEETKKGSIS